MHSRTKPRAFLVVKLARVTAARLD